MCRHRGNTDTRMFQLYSAIWRASAGRQIVLILLSIAIAALAAVPLEFQRDIVNHLGSREFFRIRVGIGHPGSASQVINYVLHKPSAADLTEIDKANRDTLAVMPLIVEGRIDKAMQALHT